MPESSLPDYARDLPTNTARRDGSVVIIDECIICGDSHRHGAAGFVDGESTRAPHCHTGREPPEYRVVLEDPQGGGV